LTQTEAAVAKGVAALYVANITALVLNTAFLVLLTNTVLQSEVGLVSILNVIVVGTAAIAVLALPVGTSSVSAAPPAVTRFLSFRVGGGGSSKKVYFLSAGICALLSVSIGWVVSSAPIAGIIAGPLDSSWVGFAALDAVAFSFGQLGAYSMLGVGKATSAGKAITVASLARYAAAGALLLSGWGVPGVFIGFVIGDLGLAAYANGRSYRLIPSGGAGGVPLGPVAKYMVSVLAATLVGLGVSQMDKLLAFFQRGLVDLAVYNIATVGAAVSTFAPAAATNVLVPALSSFENEPQKRKELLRNYTRYITFTAAPMGMGLAALSPFLLRVFGDQYAQAAPLMAVMSVAIALTAISAVYTSELLVEDRAHQFSVANLAGLLALVGVVVSGAYFIPSLGLMGVAFGRAVMSVVILVLLAWLVRRSGELALDGWGYLKSVAAASMMAGVVYAVLLAAQDLLGLGRVAVVTGSLVMVPVGMLVYLVLMKYIGAFDESDVQFLEMLLPGRLKKVADLARRFL
jgi:O-antigen/teichoic acid export membrane protein